MDGSSTSRSSLEALIIENQSNIAGIKSKLHEIIEVGKDYEFDDFKCLKELLNNKDQEIVLLSVQAISEIVKCEEKREVYAHTDIISILLNILRKEGASDLKELMKQCCRTLGNLCCDCDKARKVILETDGVPVLIAILSKAVDDDNFSEIQILVSKTLLNFAIGGREFSDAIMKGGIVKILHKILAKELEKDDFDDDVVSTVLLILSVINDNNSECLFDEDLNRAVLNVLKDTTNVEISELCLEHLHAQAEHESVKTLIAALHGVQLVSSRLEQLVTRHDAGDMSARDSDVEAVIKHACDLIVIVLTGDEAMHILYNNGVGEVYLTMVKWLECTNYHLLTAGVLAVGNFARQDDYCVQMMQDGIFDRLLDLFEIYHNFGVRMQSEPDKPHPIDAVTVTKIQHAVLSALRNLLVPVANKRVAAAKGKAATVLLEALPVVDDNHVAYKLLAAVRMLVDGQEGVAHLLLSNPAALSSISARAGGAGGAGAASEAPRLLAWAVKQLPHQRVLENLVKVPGCIPCLVNMLVSSHSVMQNEAILSLTLIAIQCFKKTPQTELPDIDQENALITQLIETEIGKHVSVLIETNCAKIPVEVSENLLAFLDITSKKNAIVVDYKSSNVTESLQMFMETRKDLSDDLKTCILGVLSVIAVDI